MNSLNRSIEVQHYFESWYVSEKMVLGASSRAVCTSLIKGLFVAEAQALMESSDETNNACLMQFCCIEVVVWLLVGTAHKNLCFPIRACVFGGKW